MKHALGLSLRRPVFGARVLPLLLVTTLVGLQVRAILGPYEDWPFTSAPMFARYHAPDDPLFELVVMVEPATGAEFELSPARDLGLGELGFRRQFFVQSYGSTDPRHPGGHHPNDNRQRFEARLLQWFLRVASAYAKKKGGPPQAFYLELRRLEPRVAGQRGTGGGTLERATVERRRLARFSPANGQLKLLTHPTDLGPNG